MHSKNKEGKKSSGIFLPLGHFVEHMVRVGRRLNKLARRRFGSRRARHTPCKLLPRRLRGAGAVRRLLFLHGCRPSLAAVHLETSRCRSRPPPCSSSVGHGSIGCSVGTWLPPLGLAAAAALEGSRL